MTATETTPATPFSVCIYRAALAKLNECRERCPGIGGDIDAANLAWLIQNAQRSASTEQQAARTLENLAQGLNACGAKIDAANEVSALRALDGFAALLKACEYIGNHSSGNLHGFHRDVVESARHAVKVAGGELRSIGWFRAGEAARMSNVEIELEKARRHVAKMQAQGLVWSDIRKHWVDRDTDRADREREQGAGI